MRNTFFPFFFAFCFNVFGQQYTDTTITKDYNTDGIVDTLHHFEEYGSGFGGLAYKITDGKTNEVFELSNFSSYGSIKKLIQIPPNLLKKENKSFLETFKKGLLPTNRKTADPSLKWIISTTYNSHTLKDSTYFDKVFTPKTPWITTDYESPSSYYIEIQGDSVLKFIDINIKPETDSLKIRNLQAFLIYYGKNIRDWNLKVDHEGNAEDGPIAVVANQDYKIYKTNHAILAKKGNSYKWLFISEADITGSPQKLRWSSIDKMILKDDYLIFKQNLAPDPEYNVFIIHIESGNFGRLNIDFDTLLEDEIFIYDLSPEEELSIENNTISIGRGKRSLHIPLNAVKLNLDTFKQK